jgi:hypothetical protein
VAMIDRCQGIVISRRPDDLPLRRCARASQIGRPYCQKHIAQEARQTALRGVLKDGWEEQLVANSGPLRPGPARKNEIPEEYLELVAKKPKARAPKKAPRRSPVEKVAEKPTEFVARPSREEARRILGCG